MYPLFETIKCQGKQLHNLDFHQERFEKTQCELFKLTQHPKLSNSIEIPNSIDEGLYRCRVSYTSNIINVEFIPQNARLFKTLKLVESNTISYRYKSTNRAELLSLYEQRDTADEVIIVKNNQITDCSIGNLLFKKNDKWYTPKHPLLRGTQLNFLLKEGKVEEMDITLKNLRQFKECAIVNAMLDFNDKPCIALENIINLSSFC